MSTRTSRTVAGTGLAVLGIALGSAFGEPAVSANVTSPVAPSAALGAFGTGCTYTLAVGVDSPNGTVTFADYPAGDPAHRDVIGYSLPAGTQATIRWTPQHTGERVLVATQDGSTSPEFQVTVRRGILVGSDCAGI